MHSPAVIPSVLATLSFMLVHRSASTSALDNRSRQCTTLDIPVSSTALNKLLVSSVNISDTHSNDIDALISLPAHLVSGNYTIAARYCEPAMIEPTRHKSLQILVHGATYTKDYWSGLAPPDTYQGQFNYSWIDYASTQGWPTLSIDRLCNGDSTPGDALLECQLPLEVDTLHQVVLAARSGSLPGVGRAFDNVVMACHSLGSLVCNGLAGVDPTDVDAYVLTGFSAALVNGLSGIGTLPGFLPASLVDPVRFAGLVDRPLYLSASQEEGAEFIFYYDQYDRAIAEYDFAHRRTVTAGEIATALLGQLPATEYEGKVFVMNGNEDSIFCESTPLNALAKVVGNCDQGFSEGVRDLYPRAKSFNWYNVPSTGHCLNLHFTASDSFKRVHDWLVTQGF